jgi:hypothetical protein
MMSVVRMTIWRAIVMLSIVQAGAALGNEAARYFWDLAAYVTDLDAPYPYRVTEPYPFLYPPAAADIFLLARSHLFELLSIAYVAAVAFFLQAYGRLELPRKFEWLAAITAMGGLGVLSVMTGNVAILMNFTLLALVVRAAMGETWPRHALPIAIALGALIKPQFLLYLGLLPVVERSLTIAAAKAGGAAAAALAVHGGYLLWRPEYWNEYVQAVINRTVTERDYGWGPSAMMMMFADGNGARVAGYVIGLVVVGGLAYLAWRRVAPPSPPDAQLFAVSLAFVVLTFANPRLPLYDLYAAGIALVICCSLAGPGTRIPLVLLAVLALNVIPWLIDNFTRSPSSYPWWLRHLLLTHLAGIAALLGALARSGSGSAVTSSSSGARRATLQ